MRAYNIADEDLFHSLLFESEMFDKFLMADMEVTGIVRLKMSGEITDSMRDKDSYYKDYRFIPWRECKGLAYDFVKAKKVIELCINFVHYFPNGDIGGIRIKKNQSGLLFVSVFTYAGFTLDKGAENEWDDNCEKFLKKHKVAYLPL